MMKPMIPRQLPSVVDPEDRFTAATKLRPVSAELLRAAERGRRSGSAPQLPRIAYEEDLLAAATVPFRVSGLPVSGVPASAIVTLEPCAAHATNGRSGGEWGDGMNSPPSAGGAQEASEDSSFSSGAGLFIREPLRARMAARSRLLVACAIALAAFSTSLVVIQLVGR